jgi:hypothetical protein
VRVGEKIIWSGTHRFGLGQVYEQVEIRDARFTPRYRWAPAERLTVLRQQEAQHSRAIEVIEVIRMIWRRRSGLDKFGAWRQKGEAYQLVRYKIERRYLTWTPVREVEDQSAETADTVLTATG